MWTKRTTLSSAVPHVAGEGGEVEGAGAREGKIGDPHSTSPIYHQKLSYNTNLKPIPTQLSLTT